MELSRRMQTVMSRELFRWEKAIASLKSGNASVAQIKARFQSFSESRECHFCRASVYSKEHYFHTENCDKCPFDTPIGSYSCTTLSGFNEFSDFKQGYGPVPSKTKLIQIMSTLVKNALKRASSNGWDMK